MTRPLLLGVSTPSGSASVSAALAELDAFERDAGGRAGICMWFEGWAYHEFRADLPEAVAGRGALPMITWEPWDYQQESRLDLRRGEQPGYALSRIAGGEHDAYVRRWAEGARRYGRPLLLRFAHEMNGYWYPWAEAANGNRPGEYVAAWRHVHDAFRAVGADNVAWVWSPNVVYPGATPLRQLYPGDAYVDWAGVDGYNGGTALPWGGWRTAEELFAPTLREVAALAPGKPLMIGETGSAEAGGRKAAWIRDFFATLDRHPEVGAFVWFDHRREADWRIASSEPARQAFAAGPAGLYRRARGRTQGVNG